MSSREAAWKVMMRQWKCRHAELVRRVTERGAWHCHHGKTPRPHQKRSPLSTQTSMPSPLSSLAAAHDSSTSASDPNRLAPEDAFYKSPLGRSLAVDAALGGRKRSRSNRQRSSSGRRKAKGGYKKLLWFRQPCEHTYISIICYKYSG
jgi:phage-related protein